MKSSTSDTFSLDIYEGPLPFLLHLIQKSEIDLCDIPIQEITNQYLLKIREHEFPSVDTGAEFIGTTALLLWMKSKLLLPKHEQPQLEIEDLDPSFEIIHKLLEYCRFKETAKLLSVKEEEQSLYYNRGYQEFPEVSKTLGIEHLSLEEFGKIFQEVLNRADNPKGKIHEEAWRVSDKISSIRSLLNTHGKIGFKTIFSGKHSRGELIVTFLAVLELMKIGELFVGREENSEIVLVKGSG